LPLALPSLHSFPTRRSSDLINVGLLELFKVRQPHFRGLADERRIEAALRQPALDRHLAAFESKLVIAAGASGLTLVAATRSLAQDRKSTRLNSSHVSISYAV